MLSLHKQTRNLERENAELLLSAVTGKDSGRFGYVNRIVLNESQL
jgi:hypothetical protein